MKRQNKKGFTIVELVIVIAVIAILAAVLIPTFSGLIKKAHQSADIQACRQMNTYLAVDEVDKNETIYDVYEALTAGGMKAKNYTPLTSDTYYFWDKTLNRVLYTDKDYNVLYPEEYADATKADVWLSLSGEIETVSIDTIEIITETINNTQVPMYLVKSAEELYTLAQTTISTDVKGIKLSEDIDAMGADISLKLSTTKDETFVIDGNGKTISNITTLGYHAVDNNKNYLSAFVSGSAAKTGVDGVVGTLIIKNLTFDGITTGDADTGSCGLIVSKLGQQSGVSKSGVAEAGNLTLQNVDIKNCEVYGKNKIGLVAGAIGGAESTVTIDANCSITDSTVYSCGGESAILFGGIWTNATITNNSIITNCKVSFFDIDGYKLDKTKSDADKNILGIVTYTEGTTTENRDFGVEASLICINKGSHTVKYNSASYTSESSKALYIK